MNNLASNLNHDANLLTETCRLAGLEGGGWNQREFGDTREQIYALLMRISNFNGNEKPPCPRNPPRPPTRRSDKHTIHTEQ